MPLTENDLVRAGAASNFDSNTIEVIINPTDICNFQCSYCCNKKSRENGRTLPVKILEEFIEDLGARNAEKYVFQITGGEPFLYRHRRELLEAIARYVPNKKYVNFITNGSLIYKNVDMLEAFSKEIAIKCHISVHPDQLPLDEYVARIGKIENKKLLTCKILLVPGQLERALRLEKIFQELGIATHITSVFGAGSKILDYPPEEMAFLQSYPGSNRVIFSHEYREGDTLKTRSYTILDKRTQPETFSYKAMHCAAGLNTLRLDPNGIVVPCFGWLRHNGKFDLNKKRLRDIPELNAPCVCPAQRCNCQLFLQTPKWKGKEFAPEYIRNKSVQEASS